MPKLHVPLLAGSLLALASASASATIIAPEFAMDYTVADLGSVPGLPTRYGGLTFLDGDTILIGGRANEPGGRLYTIDVVRDVGGHVSGFGGTASLYNDDGSGSGIGEFNDGGVVFHSSGVLFTSRWPANALGQSLPGSTDEDKVIDLAALGVAGSHAAVNFVPAGFAGAGAIKLSSWIGGEWYTAGLAPDGLGTFDLVDLIQVDLDLSVAGIQNLPGGPEGFVYVAAGNAGFAVDSLLVSDFSDGAVSAYELDASGDPLVATRRNFLSDLSGAEGAVIDPFTGDFLFSTFGGGDRVLVVQGFLPPTPPTGVPAPGVLALIGMGLLGSRLFQRR